MEGMQVAGCRPVSLFKTEEFMRPIGWWCRLLDANQPGPPGPRDFKSAGLVSVASDSHWEKNRDILLSGFAACPSWGSRCSCSGDRSGCRRLKDFGPEVHVDGLEGNWTSVRA